MDIIRLLPDSVANQIAAGEVIQRPASVVKELVENAVDAGATRIEVNIVDAGRTSIQVVDDGCGMSETDARLAFERHATSKIRQADDLFTLTTLGFRGEALPSIASVAQVELTTRTAEADLGTTLRIEGSRVVDQQPTACAPGSNFIVRNLFFNVPARRKFLKTDQTELTNITAELERIVLIHPEIYFILTHNGTTLLSLPPATSKQRIAAVFGQRLADKLLPVEVQTPLVGITGFVGTPESARKRGAQQFFFVGGRYMRHPYFHRAVQEAFAALIAPDTSVPYFIAFDVDPSAIDVNIHPTKTEIKFENEQAIWQILAAAVKEAVGKFNDVPSIDFDTVGKPEIPIFDPTNPFANPPKVNYNPQYNPFKDSKNKYNKADSNWEQLYQGLRPQPEQQEAKLFEEDTEAVTPSAIEDKSPVHYQYKGMYVMTAVKSGLMIIDQHRAHMRVLYDNYRRQIRDRSANSQRLLFPDVIHFSPSEVVVLQKILDEMEHIGFQLADLGQGSYAINAIPAGMEGVNAVSLVQTIVASAAEQASSVSDDIHHALALSLARSAAIPYGQVLGNDEMENLVNQLFSCGNVNYSPDGKSTLTILRQEEIARLLG